MTTSDAAFHLAALWESKELEAKTHEALASRGNKATRERNAHCAKWAREQCDALDVAICALLPIP